VSSDKREVVDTDTVEVPAEPGSGTKHTKKSEKIASKTAARSSSTKPRPSPAQKQDRKAALVGMAERLADLYACVPTHRDAEYSTQSWYLVDSLMAWNNAVAASVFTESDAEFKTSEVFQSAFLAQLQKRAPALAADAAVKKYAQSAALATEKVSEQALKNKTEIKDFSAATEVVKKSSSLEQKNIFQHLKTAHDSHLAALKQITCANLGVAFFETPSFLVPASFESREALRKKESLAEKKARLRKERHAKIDLQYPKSETTVAELPNVRFENRKAHGYYLAGKEPRARPHVVGNVLKAASDLKERGISVGMLDMSSKGKKVSFMIVNPKGDPSTCGFSSQTCYDADKTFEAIKAFVDQDPDNLRRIEVANKDLRNRIKDYLIAAHGYKGISAAWIVRNNSKYDTAVSIEFKD
jgi:hypothetical protein